MRASAVVRAVPYIATGFLRRILPALVLAAAALGSNIATSRDASAEWYGDCSTGALGHTCPSLEVACSSLAVHNQQVDLISIELFEPGRAWCITTPTPVGGLTVFETNLDCQIANIHLGWASGCRPAPPPGEGLGACGGAGGGTCPNLGDGYPGGPLGGDGQADTGSPITVTNGNKFLAVTDYRSPGPDVLEFTRYYNGRSWINSLMGLGWRHIFNADIDNPPQSPAVAHAHRPDGRIEKFTTADAGVTWTAEKDAIVGHLSKTAGGWTYTRTDDTVETYDTAGQLLSIAKKNGYTQTISRNAKNVIESVADSHGRTLTLRHTDYGTGVGWRLSHVVDPDGRIYTYEYRGLNSYNTDPWMLGEAVYPDDTPDPPESDGVSFLSHFDGAGGTRSAVDESLDRHHMNFVQPAQIATWQKTLGNASVQIINDSNLKKFGYLWIADSDDWHFGAGEFTAEAWIRFANVNGYRSLYRQWGASGQAGWTLDYDGGAAKLLRFVYSTDGVNDLYVTAPWSPAANVWYHIAADRDSGGTLRLYVDGNVVGSAAVAAAIFDSPANLDIGRFLHGWVDEARIDKGVARYAGAFTPPAAPYPDLRQDNPRVTYQYEDPVFLSGLTGVTDETGQRTTTWAYDGEGRGLSSQQAGGVGAVTVDYNADGTRTVTNALGKQFNFTVATIGLLPRITQVDRLESLPGPAATPAATMSFTYDANAFVSQVTDWNSNVTKYVHNPRGLQTSRTEAFGAPGERTTTTQWHPTFRVPTQIVAPERTTDLAYFPDGLLQTRTVTDTTTHSVPYPTNGQTRTWTYTYNAQGLVETADGPRTDVTDVTTYGYDPLTGYLTSVTDALGHATQIPLHDASGRPLKTVDANGVETTLEYDTRGRLKTRTVDSGAGGTPAVTGFAYDLAGQLESMTLPDGSALAYEYDAADRLSAIVNDFGERIEYGYDDMGNRTSQTVKAADATIVRTTTAMFDDLGRMFKSLGAYPGEETVYAYDANGNATGATDPLGNQTTSAFDALNRIFQVTDPPVDGNPPGISGYGYDTAGNRESATDQRGLQTAYVHNGFGEAIQQSSPDTGVTVYVYDSAGNRIQRTDARGVVTEWTYDALGRVLTMTFPASPAENVTYAYDDPTLGHYGIGRLASITDDSGSTSYRYDARGNIVWQQNVIGAQTYVTEYEYDLADRITRVTYPSGRTVDYAHDSIGQVTGVTTQRAPAEPVNVAVSDVTWQPFGPLASMNGAGNPDFPVSRSYDLDGRLTGLLALDTGPTPLVYQDLTFGYDLAGNILTIADARIPDGSETYGYDALHRLRSATGAYGAIAYDYDAVGNRTERDVNGLIETLAYDAFSNRLETLTAGPVVHTLGYSASGNTETDDDGLGNVSTLAYDSTDRLVTASAGATVLGAYVHNALGQRVIKTAGGATRHYIHDLSGRLIAEHDGADGSVAIEYGAIGGMLLGFIRTGVGFVALTDQIGRPVMSVKWANGAIAWEASYRPFGEVHAESGAEAINLRFPGQYHDQETGLYYNYFRTYHPALGRYLESDPIGLSGGWNTYAYVGGSPSRWIDPAGLRPVPLLLVERHLALWGYDENLWNKSSQALINAIDYWVMIADATNCVLADIKEGYFTSYDDIEPYGYGAEFAFDVPAVEELPTSLLWVIFGKYTAYIYDTKVKYKRANYECSIVYEETYQICYLSNVRTRELAFEPF